MRNTGKISALILLSITMVISSCKKEFGLAINNTDDESKLVYGCTDPTAMNYLASANSNDGSCIFSYDIAQGFWNITSECEEYDVLGLYTIQLDEQLPESINVEGTGNNELYIDINGTQVNGMIDFEGNITVPSQSVIVDIGFDPISIDVEGTGTINSAIAGTMNLTYSFANIEIPNLPLPLPISGSIDCVITLYR